ncbi:MAG: ImmA/IrrE family metallo-endopeptidase [Anaerolineae bacterium]|nr:ImmA/IrrE family metallo-endopeptidase [Anaerolineae bacterium]
MNAQNKIAKTAREMLKVANIDAPPVPVDKIAKLYGVEIRFEPFQGDRESEISGLLFQEDDTIIIGVNSLHGRNRQRFTIAHELGHYVLHNDDMHIDRGYRIHLRSQLSSQAKDWKEIQANSFAAELLMPEEMLSNDLHGRSIDYESDESLIKELADRYEVSQQAMIFRLTNLGLVR